MVNVHPARTEAERHPVGVLSHGVVWRNADFWAAPGSEFNRSGKRWRRLTHAFRCPTSPPPDPDIVTAVIASGAKRVSPAERGDFNVRAAILRATAADYHGGWPA